MLGTADPRIRWSIIEATELLTTALDALREASTPLAVSRKQSKKAGSSPRITASKSAEARSGIFNSAVTAAMKSSAD